MIKHKTFEEKNLQEVGSDNDIIEKQQRKRGRPKKSKNVQFDADEDTHEANKDDNEAKMQRFDNLRLRSSQHNNSIQTNHHPQSIMNNKELIEYYETKMNNDIDWQNTNAEDLYNFRKELNGEDSKGKDSNEEESNEKDSKGKDSNEEDSNEEDSNEEDSNEEDLNKEELNEEKVTLKNLENFAPFKNPAILETYITQANKGYQLAHVKTNDPTKISLKCKSSGCSYKIDCVLQDDGFHVVYQTGHSCEGYIKLSQQAILGAIRKVGERNNLKSKEYNDLICKQLGLKPNSIDKQIIYRAYRKVFGLTIKERLKSWGKLQSFINIIKEKGGRGIINKNKKGETIWKQ